MSTLYPSQKFAAFGGRQRMEVEILAALLATSSMATVTLLGPNYSSHWSGHNSLTTQMPTCLTMEDLWWDEIILYYSSTIENYILVKTWIQIVIKKFRRFNWFSLKQSCWNMGKWRKESNRHRILHTRKSKWKLVAGGRYLPAEFVCQEILCFALFNHYISIVCPILKDATKCWRLT